MEDQPPATPRLSPPRRGPNDTPMSAAPPSGPPPSTTGTMTTPESDTTTTTDTTTTADPFDRFVDDHPELVADWQRWALSANGRHSGAAMARDAQTAPIARRDNLTMLGGAARAAAQVRSRTVGHKAVRGKYTFDLRRRPMHGTSAFNLLLPASVLRATKEMRRDGGDDGDEESVVCAEDAECIEHALSRLYVLNRKHSVDNSMPPGHRMQAVKNWLNIAWNVSALLLNIATMIAMVVLLSLDHPDLPYTTKREYKLYHSGTAATGSGGTVSIETLLANPLTIILTEYGPSSLWEMRMIWLVSLCELIAFLGIALVHAVRWWWWAVDSMHVTRTALQLGRFSSFQMLKLWNPSHLRHHIDSLLFGVRAFRDSWPDLIPFLLLNAVGMMLALLGPISLYIRIKRVSYQLGVADVWWDGMAWVSVIALFVNIIGIIVEEDGKRPSLLLMVAMRSKKAGKRIPMERSDGQRSQAAATSQSENANAAPPSRLSKRCHLCAEIALRELEYRWHECWERSLYKQLGRKHAALFVLAGLENGAGLLNALYDEKTVVKSKAVVAEGIV